MSDFNLKVTLSEESFDQLKSGGYKMVVFKGLRFFGSECYPLVWKTITLNDQNEDLNVSWTTDSHTVFTSMSDVRLGERISPDTLVRVNLGDQCESLPNGTIQTKFGVRPGSITILNSGRQDITAGIGDEENNIYCAVSLREDWSANFVPRERLLVAFTSDEDISSSVIVYDLSGPSATIEYENGNKSHEVTFDFNKGEWKAISGGTWFNSTKNGRNISNEIFG